MSGPLPLRITSGRRRRRFVAGLPHSEMAEMAAAAAAAAAVPVIPEDVVIEILARVPDPTSLFRCAAACKRWLRLIADQAFLRRRWPPGTRPLAARGGLLLVRVLPSPSPAPQNALHLCVCNLVTGNHDVLPPLPMDCFEKDGARGYAILTAADHRVSRNPSGGYNTFFQVLLLSIHHGNHQVYLHRFSSAAASAAAAAAIFEISWSTPRNCSEQIRGYVWGPSVNRVAAVSHGAAHWLFSWGEENLYTLDVSIDTDNIGATNIPIDPPPTVFHQSWLYVSVDERLSLLYLLRQQTSYLD
uniref:F-box domain-containing protein n=1 Tax=Oryza barthii TaxID=65489 RepID=A0A0D3GXC8_9ORYZ